MSTKEEIVARWYIVHAYSGQEDRVKKNLDQRVATMDVQDKILQVVVPTEAELEIKGGRRQSKTRKVFQGYILVQMMMDDESWYVVRNTPGVTGFISAEDERDNERIQIEERGVANKVDARDHKGRNGDRCGVGHPHKRVPKDDFADHAQIRN